MAGPLKTETRICSILNFPLPNSNVAIVHVIIEAISAKYIFKTPKLILFEIEVISLKGYNIPEVGKVQETKQAPNIDKTDEVFDVIVLYTDFYFLKFKNIL